MSKGHRVAHVFGNGNFFWSYYEWWKYEFYLWYHQTSLLSNVVNCKVKDLNKMYKIAKLCYCNALYIPDMLSKGIVPNSESKLKINAY